MLNNLNVKYFPFFGSMKTPVTAAGTSDPLYNSGYDIMILEVSGDCSAIDLVIEGCVNQLNDKELPLPEADCEYSNLTILKSDDFSIIDKIEEKGVYYVPVLGRSRVRAKINSISGSAIILGALEK